jgi:beta-lactam-binding protein with PASTA domain
MSTLPPIDGRYQVADRIATGGMGQVYRGYDTVLGREVAIKVLHAALAGDEAFIDRFRREARAAALLNHPNIVAVYDWGETDGTYFMIMELVNGHNVRDLLSAHGRLDAGQVADVLAQTLAGLGHAHREGIVHRDIKPENILVTREGVVKVADFGLARAYAESRITQAPGTVTGTVQYLAPEQIQGEPADPRTDLYSLGVVGYELLTGVPPFTGETSVAVAYQHVRDHVPAPSKAESSVPKAMDHVVLWATDKDPNKRPGSASELEREVAQLRKDLPSDQDLATLVKGITSIDVPLEHAPTVTIPQAVPAKGSKGAHRRGKRRGRRLLAWVAVLLLIVAGAWAAWNYVLSAEVPAVVGMGAAQARAQLEAAGFKVVVAEGVYAADVPRGDIAQQDPSGGRVLKWLGVTLHPSLGSRTVAVPSLLDMTQEEATAALDRAGLSLGTISRYPSADVKPNLVMSQDPARGKADAGSAVDITLSTGPPPVAMPVVEGLTEQRAILTLKTAGLEPTTTEKYSQDAPRGQVISQSVKAGEPVPQGSKVALIVSLGPKTFPMPDVKRMTASAAIAQLKSLGLKPSTSTAPGSTGNIVFGQQPSAGSTVKAGQTVTIFIGG